MQYGSEPMLIDGFAGGVPCSVIVPTMALAVAGSTGSVTGAGGCAVRRSCRSTAAAGSADQRHDERGACKYANHGMHR